MNNFDIQRVENAVWTLLQYQDDIVSRASDMKLEDYEIKGMFDTLHYVRGLAEKSVSDASEGGDNGKDADDVVNQCEHQWASLEWFDMKTLQTIRKRRCNKCGATSTEIL